MPNIEQFDPNADQTPVFHKNNDIFKRKGESWQFVYRNSEVIRNILPLKFGENEGMLIISDGKITKWTNFIPQKKVYVKVKDRAGNESRLEDSACSTVSLDLQAIKDYIPSGKILDIDEYGNILYTYSSPDGRLFYGGDLIDTEVGIYDSEIFNGSNSLVAWQSLNWRSTEPTGTSVTFQVRGGNTEDEILDAEWSEEQTKGTLGYVPLDFISSQFIQYRAILRSTTRSVSPTLHSVTVRNLTAAASHFFTTNFVLPKRMVSGILTENSIIPVSADIVYGINTNNSVDFSDYQIVEPNRIFTTASDQLGSNLRIGVKFISPGVTLPSSQDPYNVTTHLCNISFVFENTDSTTKDFHFRVTFFNDVQRTQPVYYFFSGNDQTGWSYNNGTVFPGTGLNIAAGSTRTVTFDPGTLVTGGDVLYLTIEAYDGTSYEDVSLHDSYTCNNCSPEYDPYCSENIPILKNLALIFSLENGETIKLNI